MAVAGESAIGSLLLPIFALEYAGIDPHLIRQTNTTTTAGVNATVTLAELLVSQIDRPVDVLLPTGTVLPAASQIALLAMVPLLVAAAAGYVLVSLSVAVGRRPVLLLAGASTWAGALWAGFSTSSSALSPLVQHVAARGVMAVGASAANVLVPLVAAHDLVFLHQRHMALAAVMASQAVVTAAASGAAPYVAAYYDWRWMYYILATLGFVAWLALVALVPETRWAQRTTEELSGVSSGSGPIYADGPRYIDHGTGTRTLWTDVGVLPPPFRLEWRRAGASVLDSLRTALFPAVLWAAAVNAVLLMVQQAMVRQMAAVMQAQGWPFALRGVGAAVAVGAAGVAAVPLAGPLGSAFSLAVTRHLRAQQVRRESMLIVEDQDRPRRRLTSRREAEHNLPLMVLPFALSIAGCFLFGATAQSGMHWAMLVVAAFLAILGLLLAWVVLAVLLVESYPGWAGACLAHAAGGLRLLAAAMLLRGDVAARLVVAHGFLNAWALYAEVLIVASLGLPALFFGGRQLRAWVAGTVSGDVMVEDSDEGDDGAKDGKNRAGAMGKAKRWLQRNGRAPSLASSTASTPEPQARPPGSRGVHFNQRVDYEDSVTGRAM